MTSGHPRVKCAVAGCGRGTTTIENQSDWYFLNTGTNEPGWLCSMHWRRVPQSLKARRRLVNRLRKRRMKEARVKAYWELPPGSARRLAIVQAERLLRQMWTRCVRIAAGEPIADSGAVPAGLKEELRRAGL